MNEANITPAYLKRKFPGDARMHAVIDYIKRDTGLTTYIYIAFASDDAGTDFTLTPSSTLEYIAILSTTIKKASPVVADFNGLWFKRIGDDGREIELNVSAGYLVWRYVGDLDWTQLMAVPTPYSLPVATPTVLGGVKLGTGINILDGVISVATTFLELTDVIDETYTGKALYIPSVTVEEDGLELKETTELQTVLAKFTLLADCPSSLAGMGGMGIRVKQDETGLEFYTI